MSGFQVGYRVRVLRGRQFSDFKERDEGVILDINEECRNCTVVFDGRPEKIQVALKHLRVIGHSNQANLAPDGGARSQKVLAKQIAEEMRLADLPAVQALDVELQELRNSLQSAQKRLKSYEVKDERQAEEILQLTRELNKVKQEELQSDLATARSEAAAQEMLAQVALQRQELTEERRLVASLQRQVEHDTPIEAATLHKELELLRSEYQALAAKESTQAWKEYDLELRSEAATCETLRAELAAEQAQHELVSQVAQGGLKKTITEDMQKMLFKAAAEGTLVELLQQKKLSSEILSLQAPDGTTLLHMALESSPTAMVAQMALEREKQRFEHTLRVQLDHHQHCAILNCRAGAQKQTPLQVLCSSPQVTREAVVTLLEMHADPTIKDLTGSTAFLDCATHGRCELVRTLLQCSGDFLPHALDGLHRTALHRAALHGHLETVELLMQVGVPVDAIDDDGHTALDYARAHQQIDVMRALDPKASETSQKVMGTEHEQVPKPPSPPETKDVQANGEYATPVFTFADNTTEVERPPPPEAQDTAGPLPDLRSPPQTLPGHPQAFGPSPTPAAPTAPAPIPEAFSQSFSHEIHAPRPQHPQAFGARNGHSFAFNASVPTEGPTVADHLNVFGAAAGPYVQGRESPMSATVVPTEGPTAADHFNVYGGGRVATPPPPPPRGGLGFRSASDTRLGDRLYGGNVNRAASDDRLGERSKSLNARRFRSEIPTTVGDRGERRVSKVTAAPRNLSGVEALKGKDMKDLIHRRGLPMETEPDLEATLNPKDGNEGDSLRKRLGKRPNWNNLQMSPGRRADEGDDEPSWGSWF